MIPALTSDSYHWHPWTRWQPYANHSLARLMSTMYFYHFLPNPSYSSYSSAHPIQFNAIRCVAYWCISVYLCDLVCYIFILHSVFVRRFAGTSGEGKSVEAGSVELEEPLEVTLRSCSATWLDETHRTQSHPQSLKRSQAQKESKSVKKQKPRKQGRQEPSRIWDTEKIMELIQDDPGAS